MRSSTAFVFLAACAIVACGGGATSITDNTGATGGTGGTGTKPKTDPTTTVNALLQEITSSQNAISKGASGGGAANRLPAPGLNLSVRGASAAAAAGALADQQPDNAALCILDPAAVLWNCPTTVSPAGDTVAVSFQFLDTANAPQPHFDSTTTAAIRRISNSHYSRTAPLQTQNGPVPAAQVDTQHQDVILSGILTGKHAQNGTGTIVHIIAVQGRDTAFVTAPTTTTGILTSNTVPYPVGGSYTAVVHTVQGASTSTTTQVTSFDGSKVATLVINFAAGGQPRTCTYDMTSPAPAVCTGGPAGPP
jgi:hypothetical protein